MPATYFVPLSFAAFSQEPGKSEKPVSGTPGATAGTADPGKPAVPGTQQPSGAPPGMCGTEIWYMLPAMLLIMYFMVLRPESKRRKQQQALLTSIKQGDRVVTLGGMHGVVAKLTEKTVTLRVDTLMMTFDRVAITRVERDDAASAPAKS
jgi:preprotein translocase subunit YajC